MILRKEVEVNGAAVPETNGAAVAATNGVAVTGANVGPTDNGV